jgi:hypothetical protein
MDLYPNLILLSHDPLDEISNHHDPVIQVETSQLRFGALDQLINRRPICSVAEEAVRSREFPFYDRATIPKLFGQVLQGVQRKSALAVGSPISLLLPSELLECGLQSGFARLLFGLGHLASRGESKLKKTA